MRIYAYKRGLRSVALLREYGGRVRYDTSRVQGGAATAWGASDIPPWANNVRWVNHPSAVRMVSNKLNWAQLCNNQGFGPEAYFTRQEAERVAAEPGEKVVCRTLLNASGGRGITIARNYRQVVDAKLYTRYVAKTSEYRVIFGEGVGAVYAASKRRPTDFDGGRDDLLVRTLDRGFVYQVEDEVPIAVLGAVMEVQNVLTTYGLRLLAYDVTYNAADNTACVLEANTAPGLNDTSAPLVMAALEDIGAAR